MRLAEKRNYPHRLYSTADVCSMVSLSMGTIHNILSRYPHLRPASAANTRFAKLTWTDADVIRLINFRLNPTEK